MPESTETVWNMPKSKYISEVISDRQSADSAGRSGAYLDSILQWLYQKQDSHLSNSAHFVAILKKTL